MMLKTQPIWLLLAAQFIAGCASSSKDEVPAGPRPGVSRPPIFLVAPMGLFFTNGAEGFNARLVVAGQGSSSPGDLASGQLLCRGSKLLFTPDYSGSTKDRARGGELSFVWDTAESRGYVLSEVLQAYAPCALSARATNIVATVEPGPAQKVEGHPCEVQAATVSMSDGSTAIFRVFRATDLKGLAIRILSATNLPSQMVSLSKIRLESPPPDLFAPPTGFTKYNSGEAMMDELVARQRGLLKRHGPEDLGPPPPTSSVPQQYRQPR